MTPFGPGSGLGFAQGTSATYTWMVARDVQGPAEAMGGRDRAAQRLDAFFHNADGSWSVKGGRRAALRPDQRARHPRPLALCSPGPAVEDTGDGPSDPRTVHGTGPAACPATATWGPCPRGTSSRRWGCTRRRREAPRCWAPRSSRTR
ncbi:glycoside hydrolase domain-containing protein [Streptomyces sp. 900116325]